MGLAVRPRMLIKFLESHGFVFARSRGTSHHIYKKGGRTVSIPVHNRDLTVGILSSILLQADLDRKAFEKWLGR